MRRLLILLSTFALALPAVRAEEKLPGFELRVKSVNDLVGYFEYVGGLAGQGEQGKQFAELVKAFGGTKGVIEGADLKRPIGAYAIFTPGMVDSQLVVMIPVADEKAFLGLLKSRLSLDPKEDGDNEGVYRVQVPKFAPPILFRFHKDYACVTLNYVKNIDPANLIDPKTFFAAPQEALISVALHIDRVPEEFRKVAFGQFELNVNDSMAKSRKKDDIAFNFGLWLATEGGLRSVKCLFDDAKTLSLRLFVEPKTDDLALVATLTAKAGSDFQKVLQSLPGKPVHAARAAAAADPVVAVALNFALPPDMTKELGTKIDELINDASKKAGGDQEAVVKIFDAFAPTLKAGEYELGAAITGTEKGKLRLVAASRATEGKGVEKLAKEFATFIPEDSVKFDFDAAKIPGGNLHKITVTNDDLKRLYGSESVWAGITDSLFVIGLEPDGEEAKRIASLQPATADMLSIRIAATRFLALVDPSLEEAMLKEAIGEVFGSAVKPGTDEFKLTVTGGETLTVKLAVKGKLIEFLAKMEAKKKAK